MAYIVIDENNYWTGDMCAEAPLENSVEIEAMPEGFLEQDGLTWKSYRYEDGALVFDEERYATLKAEYDASIEEAETTPTVEDDLMSMAVDHEYRITMLELFSDTATE